MRNKIILPLALAAAALSGHAISEDGRLRRAARTCPFSQNS